MTGAMDLIKLIDQFGNEDACLRCLEHLRWPHGPCCLRCGSIAVNKIPHRETYHCSDCYYQSSVKVGTIFGDSHLPLTKWFLATYLMTESKKGISANQLKRMLKVSYKTAWYLCHRIRKAMDEANPEPLRNTVEVDETYIGGKRRHVGSGYRGNKTMVLGAIERGGRIRLRAEMRKTADRKTLHQFIADTTAPDTARIMTDENPSYLGIADHDTTHETVNHHIEEWVRGDVHTNNVESAWSLFKRSIVGAFHQVSAKHLQAYLDEFEFRFNNRQNPYLFRDTLLKLIDAPTLQYKDLTRSA
jgi:transposase-like protein